MGTERWRKGLGSLDLILTETRIERDAQLRHFEGLDSKLGILLGFSGALVALAPTNGLVIGLGRLVAAVAGLVSLWAFWPRKFAVMDPYVLRQKYLPAEPEFTQLKILDTHVAMLQATAIILQRKARRLKWAMSVLAVAILLVALGLGLD
ncbi:MAG: hypothetical protein ACRDHO_14115 [Actinomycetota bacterium]